MRLTYCVFMNRVMQHTFSTMFDISQVVTPIWWYIIYKNVRTPIPIICKKCHNTFEREARYILAKKKVPLCKKCLSVQNQLTYEDFLENLKLNNLDTSDILINKEWWDTNYKGKNTTKIPCKCGIHGIFDITIPALLKGSYCKKCATLNTRKTYEVFLQEANRVHHGLFEYTAVSETWWAKNYINIYKPKIPITCNTHGLFFQTYNTHIYGSGLGSGCPKCKSSKGELAIMNYLNNRKIDYVYQYPVKIKDSLHIFDFFIPELKLIIEYDGEQHEKPFKFFGGKNGFRKIRKRDNIKDRYCIENEILLKRITHREYDKVNEILSNLF